MRSCIVLKDANAEKFVANRDYSFTFVFTFSAVVVVNFVVVLKFPIIERIQTRVAISWLSERSGEKTECLRTF